MNFLKNDDYNVLIRTEIKQILLDKSEADSQFLQSKLIQAEQMAIAQSHEWHFFLIIVKIEKKRTKSAPNKIPVHRSERYADALDWLKNISKGTASANLPQKINDNGQVNSSIKISSNYKTNKNKY